MENRSKTSIPSGCWSIMENYHPISNVFEGYLIPVSSRFRSRHALPSSPNQSCHHAPSLPSKVKLHGRRTRWVIVMLIHNPSRSPTCLRTSVCDNGSRGYLIMGFVPKWIYGKKTPQGDFLFGFSTGQEKT